MVFFKKNLFRLSNITLFSSSNRLIWLYGHQWDNFRDQKFYPQIDPFDPKNLTLKKANAKSYVSKIYWYFPENTLHQSIQQKLL